MFLAQLAELFIYSDKMLCASVWTLTRVVQVITAAHKDL